MIVVHWDGGPKIPVGYEPVNYYATEARIHIEQDWGDGDYGYGLAYHEKMDRSGRLYLTRPAEHIVWACRGANDISYNLCLDATVGQPPTAAQLEALPGRLDTLRARYGVSRVNVRGHGELTEFGNLTSCPGSRLQLLLAEYRGGR